MISFHLPFKCQDSTPIMEITQSKSRINSTCSLQCKLLIVISQKSKTPLRTLLANTRNRSSCGKKPYNKTSKPSLNKEKINIRGDQRRSTLMERKKRMKHSNGWQTRFYKVFKLKSQLLSYLMRRFHTSLRLNIKSLK